MELRSSGIIGLDKLLHGGLPSDGLTVILGDAGSGKSLLSRQFLWEGIHKKEPGVCILTETHRDAMNRSMQEFGWDITPFKDKNVKIIDGFTLSYPSLLDQVTDEDLPYTLSTLNLDKVMHLVTSACSQLGSKGRLMFDGLTDLFLLTGDDRKVLRFMRRLKVFISGQNYATIMTLDPATQDTISTRAAMHVADGIIEIRLREGTIKEGLKREIRVRAMPQGHESTWHPIKITPNGLVVEI